MQRIRYSSIKTASHLLLDVLQVATVHQQRRVDKVDLCMLSKILEINANWIKIENLFGLSNRTKPLES